VSDVIAFGMKIRVFMDVAHCGLVEIYRRFGATSACVTPS